MTLGLEEMLRQVPVLRDSAFVLLAFDDVHFRVEAEAVLVEDGEELAGHQVGRGHRLEDRGVQGDLQFLALVGRGVPYNHEGVVSDQRRLGVRRYDGGGVRRDHTEGDGGQEGRWSHVGCGETTIKVKS